MCIDKDKGGWTAAGACVRMWHQMVSKKLSISLSEYGYLLPRIWGDCVFQKTKKTPGMFTQYYDTRDTVYDILISCSWSRLDRHELTVIYYQRASSRTRTNRYTNRADTRAISIYYHRASSRSRTDNSCGTRLSVTLYNDTTQTPDLS